MLMKFHDSRSRAREAAAFALKLAALFAVLAIMAADSRAVEPLGAIPLTTNVYTAVEVDSLVSGLAGMADTTNYVAEAVAQYGAADPAAELHRLVLADLWRRVDALEGSDGSGYVTAAAVEELVADRVEDELSTWGSASGCIPVKVLGASRQTLNGNHTDVSLDLSPLSPVVLSSNQSNVYTLSLSSLNGTSANPCLLKFVGWRSVAWPSGTLVKTGYSYNANGNLYRVYRVDGATVAERIYP